MIIFYVLIDDFLIIFIIDAIDSTPPSLLLWCVVSRNITVRYVIIAR